MEPRKYGRGRHGLHASTKQKKKLIGFMARHPELIAAKITTAFSYADRHRLWQAISDECNTLPGAKKDWRQWRKTWQDLRSKYRKQYSGINENNLPPHLAELTAAERAILGLDTTLSELKASEIGPHTEDRLQTQNTLDNNSDFAMEMPQATYSEPDSPPESKVFTRSKIKLKNRNQNMQHSDSCSFDCDRLAVHEQRKLEMKQDYINFKKNYLQQKLKLIKEQTEALKTIARELSDE